MLCPTDDLPSILLSVRVQEAPEPCPLFTAGMPLGHSLPAKLKQDIWDGKYRDMASLLYADTHTSYGVWFANDTSDEGGGGELEFTKQRKKITKAFATFISVYIQRPGTEGDVTDLLAYMHEVQSIAEDGFDWASYDKLYRRDHASTLNPPQK